MNHRAHSVWTAVLLGLPVLAATGCFVVHDRDDDGDVIIVEDPEIESVRIDEGATLDAEPGVGAGVFIEHLGYGEWNIWATCDTEITGFACTYDIFVSADGLGFVESIDLEGGDFIVENFESAHVGFDTDFDFDGFAFSTFEDEPVLIEVWLDGAPDGRLVFWVQGNDVWQGLPTNPTWFIP